MLLAMDGRMSDKINVEHPAVEMPIDWLTSSTGPQLSSFSLSRSLCASVPKAQTLLSSPFTNDSASPDTLFTGIAGSISLKMANGSWGSRIGTSKPDLDHCLTIKFPKQDFIIKSSKSLATSRPGTFCMPPSIQ